MVAPNLSGLARVSDRSIVGALFDLCFCESKKNKMQKAFIDSILGTFHKKKNKPDFIKTLIKNEVQLKGKNVIQKK